MKVIQSCLTFCNPMDYTVHEILQAKNTGVGSLSLQGIFPSQGSNLHLPHHRHTLYQLSYKGSPRIMEWVAYPFSSGSSQPRNWIGVSCIAGRFFTNWAIREAWKKIKVSTKNNLLSKVVFHIWSRVKDFFADKKILKEFISLSQSYKDY